MAVRILGILCIAILTACAGPVASRPSPLPLTPPPREIAISPAAANTFRERLQGALDAQEANIAIEIHEEELTSFLVLSVQGAGYKAGVGRRSERHASALRIWITHDGVWVHTPIPWEPDRDPRAKLKADDGLLALLRPTVSEDTLHVTIDAARWHGRALPRWLLTLIEAAANDALVDASLPANVEQIVLGEGALRIVLTPR